MLSESVPRCQYILALRGLVKTIQCISGPNIEVIMEIAHAYSGQCTLAYLSPTTPDFKYTYFTPKMLDYSANNSFDPIEINILYNQVNYENIHAMKTLFTKFPQTFFNI